MNMIPLFFQRMGPGAIILLIVVVLLLFGGKKIPELMKGLGSGLKEFKKATKDEDEAHAKKKQADSHKNESA